jgi:DNA adenine methylase
LPLLPEHKGYVEVFGGAGYLLFAKAPSQWEVLNDLDNNLMNFWYVVQNHYQEFIDSFRFVLVSRDTFDKYKIKYKTNNYSDNIERAHIFYYLTKAGFGADMKNPVFGTGQGRNRLRLEQIEDDIIKAHKRLLKVVIENKPFEDMLRIYDGRDTFFYLDPPYRNVKQYPVGKFTDEQYQLLAEYCQHIHGKWLLTINDDEYIKRLFGSFNIIPHNVYYNICQTQNGRRSFKELIITNYDISEVI